MAHLGVLKALERNGIVVDMIAGTSAGAMTISAARLRKHLLRGSQLERRTSRQGFEQIRQAWVWSGLAGFGPTTPTRAGCRTR
jgi:predicted acylesterase/phospholipase RssA